ncbi:hypothetical protein [Homoserinibacter sp. GY 40078]|uniref:hypothetical protein n=1 Tax=Homoserinibacter sp. GY 40078 TaxID=2603275 RepID=UPI0011C93307|nr:hypothetical protein [Homoserinibacter sp. GY 40078]TXK19478.1 hypothetical protein FVQ89_06190 [Homoserinibacter sp. GY 40078]
MSTGARFQFVRIDPSDPVRMSSWIHHISRLTGIPADPAATPTHAVHLWHLVAGNHRVLARSASAFATVDEGWADVEAALEARDRLVARMARLESSRGYGWVLYDGSRAMMTSARWYTMERDRRESLRSTREALDVLAAAPRGGEELVADGGARA